MKVPIKDYKNTLQNLLDKIQEAAKEKNLTVRLSDGCVTVEYSFESLSETLSKEFRNVFKSYKDAKKTLTVILLEISNYIPVIEGDMIRRPRGTEEALILKKFLELKALTLRKDGWSYFVNDHILESRRSYKEYYEILGWEIPSV